MNLYHDDDDYATHWTKEETQEAGEDMLALLSSLRSQSKGLPSMAPGNLEKLRRRKPRSASNSSHGHNRNASGEPSPGPAAAHKKQDVQLLIKTAEDIKALREGNPNSKASHGNGVSRSRSRSAGRSNSGTLSRPPLGFVEHDTVILAEMLLASAAVDSEAAARNGAPRGGSTACSPGPASSPSPSLPLAYFPHLHANKHQQQSKKRLQSGKGAGSGSSSSNEDDDVLAAYMSRRASGFNGQLTDFLESSGKQQQHHGHHHHLHPQPQPGGGKGINSTSSSPFASNQPLPAQYHSPVSPASTSTTVPGSPAPFGALPPRHGGLMSASTSSSVFRQAGKGAIATSPLLGSPSAFGSFDGAAVSEAARKRRLSDHLDPSVNSSNNSEAPSPAASRPQSGAASPATTGAAATAAPSPAPAPPAAPPKPSAQAMLWEFKAGAQPKDYVDPSPWIDTAASRARAAAAAQAAEDAEDAARLAKLASPRRHSIGGPIVITPRKEGSSSASTFYYGADKIPTASEMAEEAVARFRKQAQAIFSGSSRKSPAGAPPSVLSFSTPQSSPIALAAPAGGSGLPPTVAYSPNVPWSNAVYGTSTAPPQPTYSGGVSLGHLTAKVMAEYLLKSENISSAASLASASSLMGGIAAGTASRQHRSSASSTAGSARIGVPPLLSVGNGSRENKDNSKTSTNSNRSSGGNLSARRHSAPALALRSKGVRFAPDVVGGLTARTDDDGSDDDDDDDDEDKPSASLTSPAPNGLGSPPPKASNGSKKTSFSLADNRQLLKMGGVGVRFAPDSTPSELPAAKQADTGVAQGRPDPEAEAPASRPGSAGIKRLKSFQLANNKQLLKGGGTGVRFAAGSQDSTVDPAIPSITAPQAQAPEAPGSSPSSPLVPFASRKMSFQLGNAKQLLAQAKAASEQEESKSEESAAEEP